MGKSDKNPTISQTKFRYGTLFFLDEILVDHLVKIAT